MKTKFSSFFLIRRQVFCGQTMQVIKKFYKIKVAQLKILNILAPI
jgi:hypothetical protein